MQIEKRTKTVSNMLTITKNLRELWADLNNQVNKTSERFKEINKKLETVQTVINANILNKLNSGLKIKTNHALKQMG